MANKEWEKFDSDFIEEIHGHIYYYRDLYEGKHAELFPRAVDLIAKGEITDNIIDGAKKAQNVQTPYIIANISKMITEIPAMLVSRSIGNIESSLSEDLEQAAAVNEETEEIIDLPGEDAEDVTHVQQDIIDQIVKNSNLKFEHWSNVLQQQLDGGLVGVPWQDDQGLRIEFKGRDVYYPHDDGLGVDLAYEIEQGEDKYLHVYREEVIKENLETSHMLYSLNDQRKTTRMNDDEAKEVLGIEQLEKTYTGRGRPFIMYWPNAKTFMNPLGSSCLKGQDGKQDEVNWTLTRNAITFERNGKPRIAITKELMQELEDRAFQQYGEASKIDHREFEVMTMDDDGNSMEIIQIDITKIGDIAWVKDLVKLMLMETKTSEKAVDFFSEGGGRADSQSGIAKFYDLFTSLTKAEQIQDEYVYFLQQLIESALWIANLKDANVQIEEPEIALNSMIPISRKEMVEENSDAYEAGVQSLETTIRRSNPTASETWVMEELERVEAGNSSVDSLALAKGRQDLTQMMGNPNKNRFPENEDEWTDKDQDKLDELLDKKDNDVITSEETAELKALKKKKKDLEAGE